MANPDIVDLFDYRHFNYVNEPYHGFPAGLQVVEIYLNSNFNGIKSWNKNARQTTFDGYSPKMEFYAPEYPNGPIEGDVDYRRTIYWNPDVKTNERGVANIKFYNNSYSRSLNVSVEGMANEGAPLIKKL
jgi:hypothetical protein